MNHFSNRKLKLLLRSIALALIASLLTTQNASAGIGSATLARGATGDVLAAFPLLGEKNLSLPDAVASVDEIHHGRRRDLVIYIQDAHASYSAQKNIAEVIRRLTEKSLVNLVAIEGAEGEIDTEILRAFPVPQITEQILERHLRKGTIAGPQFMASTAEKPFDLVGIDRHDLYLKNLAAFDTVHSLRPETSERLKKIRTALQNLKPHVFSPELKRLDRLFSRRSDKEPLQNTILTAVREFQKAKIGVIASEATPSGRMSLRGSEATEAVSVLRSPRPLRSLATLRGLLRPGFHRPRNDAKHLYPELTKIDALLKENPGTDSLKPTDINARALFDELNRLTISLKMQAAETADARQLVALEEYLFLFERAGRLELSRTDQKLFRKLHDRFSGDRLVSSLNRLTDKYRLRASTFHSSDAKALGEIAGKIFSFYDTAEARDREFFIRLKKEMATHLEHISVLVTGGYHREGVTEALRRAGYSYAVVTPRMTADASADAYADLMRKSTAQLGLPSESTLAPFVPLSRSTVPASHAFVASVTAEEFETAAEHPARYGFDSLEEIRSRWQANVIHTGERFWSGRGLTWALETWSERHTGTDASAAQMESQLINGLKQFSFALPSGFGASGEDDSEEPFLTDDEIINRFIRIGDLITSAQFEKAADLFKTTFSPSDWDASDVDRILMPLFDKYLMSHAEHLPQWKNIDKSPFVIWLKQSPWHAHLVLGMLNRVKSILETEEGAELLQRTLAYLIFGYREADTNEDNQAIRDTMDYIQKKENASIPASELIIQEMKSEKIHFLIHGVTGLLFEYPENDLFMEYLLDLITDGGITDLVFPGYNAEIAADITQRFMEGQDIGPEISGLEESDDDDYILTNNYGLQFIRYVSQTDRREDIQNVAIHFPNSDASQESDSFKNLEKKSPELVSLTEKLLRERKKTVVVLESSYALKQAPYNSLGREDISLYEWIGKKNRAWLHGTRTVQIVHQHYTRGQLNYLLAATYKLIPPVESPIGYTLATHIHPEAPFADQPVDSKQEQGIYNTFADADLAVVLAAFDEDSDDEDDGGDDGIPFQPSPNDEFVDLEPETIPASAVHVAGFGAEEEKTETPVRERPHYDSYKSLAETFESGAFRISGDGPHTEFVTRLSNFTYYQGTEGLYQWTADLDEARRAGLFSIKGAYDTNGLAVNPLYNALTKETRRKHDFSHPHITLEAYRSATKLLEESPERFRGREGLLLLARETNAPAPGLWQLFGASYRAQLDWGKMPASTSKKDRQGPAPKRVAKKLTANPSDHPVHRELFARYRDDPTFWLLLKSFTDDYAIQALQLRFVEDLDVATAAQRMNISKADVIAHEHAALFWLWNRHVLKAPAKSRRVPSHQDLAAAYNKKLFDLLPPDEAKALALYNGHYQRLSDQHRRTSRNVLWPAETVRLQNAGLLHLREIEWNRKHPHAHPTGFGAYIENEAAAREFVERTPVIKEMIDSDPTWQRVVNKHGHRGFKLLYDAVSNDRGYPSDAFFLHGMSELVKQFNRMISEETREERFEDYWPDLVMLIRESWSHTLRLFQNSIPRIHRIFGKDFLRYWDDLMRLSSETQSRADFFMTTLPHLGNFFGNDRAKALFERTFRRPSEERFDFFKKEVRTKIRQQLGIHHDTLVVVAGSTQTLEEDRLAIETVGQLRKQTDKKIILLLVPRGDMGTGHRGDPAELEPLLKNIPHASRTDIIYGGKPTPEEGIIIYDHGQKFFPYDLIQREGHLAALYGAADAAIVGGNIFGEWAHNVSEPLVFDVPTITGNRDENEPIRRHKGSAHFTILKSSDYKSTLSELTDWLTKKLRVPPRASGFGAEDRKGRVLRALRERWEIIGEDLSFLWEIGGGDEKSFPESFLTVVHAYGKDRLTEKDDELSRQIVKFIDEAIRYLPERTPIPQTSPWSTLRPHSNRVYRLVNNLVIIEALKSLPHDNWPSKETLDDKFSRWHRSYKKISERLDQRGKPNLPLRVNSIGIIMPRLDNVILPHLNQNEKIFTSVSAFREYTLALIYFMYETEGLHGADLDWFNKNIGALPEQPAAEKGFGAESEQDERFQKTIRERLAVIGEEIEYFKDRESARRIELPRFFHDIVTRYRHQTLTKRDEAFDQNILDFFAAIYSHDPKGTLTDEIREFIEHSRRLANNLLILHQLKSADYWPDDDQFDETLSDWRNEFDHLREFLPKNLTPKSNAAELLDTLPTLIADAQKKSDAAAYASLTQLLMRTVLVFYVLSKENTFFQPVDEAWYEKNIGTPRESSSSSTEKGFGANRRVLTPDELRELQSVGGIAPQNKQQEGRSPYAGRTWKNVVDYASYLLEKYRHLLVGNVSQIEERLLGISPTAEAIGAGDIKAFGTLGSIPWYSVHLPDHRYVSLAFLNDAMPVDETLEVFLHEKLHYRQSDHLFLAHNFLDPDFQHILLEGSNQFVTRYMLNKHRKPLTKRLADSPEINAEGKLLLTNLLEKPDLANHSNFYSFEFSLIEQWADIAGGESILDFHRTGDFSALRGPDGDGAHRWLLLEEFMRWLKDRISEYNDPPFSAAMDRSMINRYHESLRTRLRDEDLMRWEKEIEALKKVQTLGDLAALLENGVSPGHPLARAPKGAEREIIAAVDAILELPPLDLVMMTSQEIDGTPLSENLLSRDTLLEFIENYPYWMNWIFWRDDLSTILPDLKADAEAKLAEASIRNFKLDIPASDNAGHTPAGFGVKSPEPQPGSLDFFRGALEQIERGLREVTKENIRDTKPAEKFIKKVLAFITYQMKTARKEYRETVQREGGVSSRKNELAALSMVMYGLSRMFNMVSETYQETMNDVERAETIADIEAFTQNALERIRSTEFRDELFNGIAVAFSAAGINEPALTELAEKRVGLILEKTVAALESDLKKYPILPVNLLQRSIAHATLFNAIRMLIDQHINKPGFTNLNRAFEEFEEKHAPPPPGSIDPSAAGFGVKSPEPQPGSLDFFRTELDRIEQELRSNVRGWVSKDPQYERLHPNALEQKLVTIVKRVLGFLAHQHQAVREAYDEPKNPKNALRYIGLAGLGSHFASNQTAEFFKYKLKESPAPEDSTALESYWIALADDLRSDDINAGFRQAVETELRKYGWDDPTIEFVNTWAEQIREKFANTLERDADEDLPPVLETISGFSFLFTEIFTLVNSYVDKPGFENLDRALEEFEKKHLPPPDSANPTPTGFGADASDAEPDSPPAISDAEAPISWKIWLGFLGAAASFFAAAAGYIYQNIWLIPQVPIFEAGIFQYGMNIFQAGFWIALGFVLLVNSVEKILSLSKQKSFVENAVFFLFKAPFAYFAILLMPFSLIHEFGHFLASRAFWRPTEDFIRLGFSTHGTHAAQYATFLPRPVDAETLTQMSEKLTPWGQAIGTDSAYLLYLTAGDMLSTLLIVPLLMVVAVRAQPLNRRLFFTLLAIAFSSRPFQYAYLGGGDYKQLARFLEFRHNLPAEYFSASITDATLLPFVLTILFLRKPITKTLSGFFPTKKEPIEKLPSTPSPEIQPAESLPPSSAGFGRQAAKAALSSDRTPEMVRSALSFLNTRQKGATAMLEHTHPSHDIRTLIFSGPDEARGFRKAMKNPVFAETFHGVRSVIFAWSEIASPSATELLRTPRSDTKEMLKRELQDTLPFADIPLNEPAARLNQLTPASAALLVGEVTRFVYEETPPTVFDSMPKDLMRSVASIVESLSLAQKISALYQQAA